VDVTKGSNTVSFTQGGRRHTVRGFTARPGYDLASGVGTVDAAYFVSELAWAVGDGKVILSRTVRGASLGNGVII
jgi:hypothetical protein